jgi:hypothetical protein
MKPQAFAQFKKILALVREQPVLLIPRTNVVVLITELIDGPAASLALVGSMEHPVPTTFENVIPAAFATQFAGLVSTTVVVAPGVREATV